MMRIALVVGVLLVAQPAFACGFWSMTDSQRKVTIGFLINSAEIKKGEKRIGTFYLDIENKSGLRTAQGKKVQFDIKNGKLRKFGKVVATVDGDDITFGKKKFTVSLLNPHKIHDVMPAFTLSVKQDDDQVIITSEEASSLCAGMHDPASFSDADAAEEVRRRVFFYLAWREVGGNQ
jgi:hypothetical protein